MDNSPWNILWPGSSRVGNTWDHFISASQMQAGAQTSWVRALSGHPRISVGGRCLCARYPSYVSDPLERQSPWMSLTLVANLSGELSCASRGLEAEACADKDLFDLSLVGPPWAHQLCPHSRYHWRSVLSFYDTGKYRRGLIPAVTRELKILL